jgi:hypothetical protein
MVQTMLLTTRCHPPLIGAFHSLVPSSSSAEEDTKQQQQAAPREDRSQQHKVLALQLLLTSCRCLGPSTNGTRHDLVFARLQRGDSAGSREASRST